MLPEQDGRGRIDEITGREEHAKLFVRRERDGGREENEPCGIGTIASRECRERAAIDHGTVGSARAGRFAKDDPDIGQGELGFSGCDGWSGGE